MGFHARGNTAGVCAEKMGSRSTEDSLSLSSEQKVFKVCVASEHKWNVCVKFRVQRESVCVKEGVQDVCQSWISVLKGSNTFNKSTMY